MLGRQCARYALQVGLKLQIAKRAAVKVKRLLLEHLADVRQCLSCAPSHPQTRHFHIAFVGRKQVSQHLKQGGLARVIWPQQRVEAILRQRKAERLQGDLAAIAPRELVDLEHALVWAQPTGQSEQGKLQLGVSKRCTSPKTRRHASMGCVACSNLPQTAH